MTTETIGQLVPVDLIHPHPNNVRLETVADAELVASIASQGVLQPITLVPVDAGWCTAGHEACYWPIAGNRRHDGAVKAAKDVVPAIIRADLAGDTTGQTAFMLIENLQRTDLTPVEEAIGYEQLAFAGMSPKHIAGATGRNVGTVRSRLRLAKLDPDQLERVHEGQISLADAEVLIEFGADPDATAELTAAAGTADFQLVVNQQRSRRDRIAANRATAAEYDTLGYRALSLADRGADGVEFEYLHTGTWRGTPLASPEGHDGCLGYFAPEPIDTFAPMTVVCANPGGHTLTIPLADDPEPTPAAAEVSAAREAARADAYATAAAAREAARVVRETRTQWFTDHLNTILPAASGKSDPLAALAGALVPLLARSDGGFNYPTGTVHADMIQVPAEIRPEKSWELVSVINGHADALATLLPSSARLMLIRLVAGLIATALDAAEIAFDRSLVARTVDLWEWARSVGYPLTTGDQAQLDSLKLALADA
ncbi:ParB/RepB/Spo0J family partition protein [Nocardioides sp.]|uniref:ParB/RepB/Spo0J family partition protein n=1 Tax=Nocardioides sp. TaxID=35761 RepID=UPI00260B1A1D|nr:ParB/RepB/Spo0J family partition protein [Nocardioides sp.]